MSRNWCQVRKGGNAKHGDTAKIAAQFVAGHFTDATRRLIKGLRTETLRRLDIAEAVMGASLLEPTARRLLGTMLKKEDGSPWYDMNSRQPYKKARIAIITSPSSPAS